MTHHGSRTSWTVLTGIVLVVLGAWLLLETFFAPLFVPLRLIFELMGRVGWPLVLIGLGILLILRARGGGWNPAGRRFLRSRSDRMIGGVLGGLATFLSVDATVMRVVFAFFTLLTGIWWGVLFYVAAMVLVPEEQYSAQWADTMPSANAPTSPPPAPPIPRSDAGASAPPVPPAPSQSPSNTSEPPQAPPVPPAPTVL